MPDFPFDSRTPRIDLPLLFAGQAQKEIHLNEAIARLDALLFLAIEGEADSPPSAPDNGLSWLVGSTPQGDWAGHAGRLALRQADNWLFAEPVEGMRLLNRASGQEWRFLSGWKVPARPALPSGGTTIDAEARSAIGQILAALGEAGIVPAV